ncbi:ferritin subunit [Vespa crabro]|uniref:ferritin subunit n=2 Tax=Vespa TaxID=7443 RepID=UPI001F01E8D3|nr:ferritin subunit [Vespa crabro]
MMKLLCVLLFASTCLGVEKSSKYQCTIEPENKVLFKNMEDSCKEKLASQIKVEVQASLMYLGMGAHFARDIINRPGFSKFFFESANEEREHAIKLIEYLLMRGQLVTNINKILQFPLLTKNQTRQEWNTGINSLKYALKLESSVTEKIKAIIKSCETNSQDYHLVDYLSGEFLEEQYKGERDLAGKISTLGKMIKEENYLGEFLFDKKLLNGEV